VDAADILKILIDRHVAGEKELRVSYAPADALQQIKEFSPSLILLDIEMPSMNGFDLLNRVADWNFDVIFTTAYDKYAIKAIRFSALDYLLKPIDIIDLQNAINRHIIKKEIQFKQQHQLVNNLISNLQQKDQSNFKLALATMEGVFFVEPRDIIRLEGEGNYTRFFFSNHKPILISHTIKVYEDILIDFDFLRVHKSHLVNKKFVDHIDGKTCFG
jgi:two-component system LytT family response regulator